MTTRNDSRWDRFWLAVAPSYALNRMRARYAAGLMRNYEAAQPGRRTSGWNRNAGDANVIGARALGELRLHARDLVRNNGWAARSVEVITGSTVGWGLVPKALGPEAAKAMLLWKRWANSTECDADGRLSFAGIQELALRSAIEGGEVLLRLRPRRPKDALSVPLQLQLLEGDFVDTSKVEQFGPSGGPTIQGVEFDAIGNRTAYWLYPVHPGSSFAKGVSRRVSADQVLHMFRMLRPGQVRGISWLAQSIVPLKDFDEFEDASLMKQKIAACFAAFVTDFEGSPAALVGQPTAGRQPIETIEPGMIQDLPPGKTITFATPPSTPDPDFAPWQLRRIASAMGITYEELSGDYSQVNFSSARMARIAHYQNVWKWRWNMLIPQLCTPVWEAAMTAAVAVGELEAVPDVEWTAPPMPMIEPDKEGLAYQRLVRTGAMTPSEMVREQGGDPDAHFEEYAADLKRLDSLGVVLDSDARKVTQTGQAQMAGGKPPPPDAAKDS